MPEQELPRCPFCGFEGRETRTGIISCLNMLCWNFKYGVPKAEWMSRPIEDELQTELNRVQAKLERFEKKEMKRIEEDKPPADFFDQVK